ncbi:Multidrug resistance-associated protein 1, partial [Boothiomyces sp. JEL0866]
MSQYQPVVDDEQMEINPTWYEFISNLYKLRKKDSAVEIAKYLDGFWTQFREHKINSSAKKPNLYYALFAAIFSPFIGSLLANLFGTILSAFEPILLQQIILYFEGERDIFISDGRILGAVLITCQIVRVLFHSFEGLASRRYNQIIKSLFTSAIYKKSLNLSLDSRSIYSEGKILNFINQDIDAICSGVGAFEETFVIPIQIIFTMYMLYFLLGPSALVAFTIVALIGIITTLISPYMGRAYSSWISAGDHRLSILREMLYAIKVIKYETLETFFKNKISKVREDQVLYLKKEFAYGSTLDVLIVSSVIIMIASTFSVYSLLGNPMTPSVIFPATLYFTKLETPLDEVSWMISSMITGYKSMKRISEFMLSKEAENHLVEGDGSVIVKEATFSWSFTNEISGDNETTPLLCSYEYTLANEFKLKTINLNINPGTTVGIVGPVGAGKSTLLSSIVGHAYLEKGQLAINGRIAYCTQQPWILTGSIEKNIVFNSTYDEERLKCVVNLCGLDRDLTGFANGIYTEIGENGVNLSGGQRARVALARSIYNDADIYLLDDPLAALDSEVGRQVFSNVILEELKEKTVILVTHQLHCLSSLDYILVMENGEIVESGKYSELVKQQGTLSQMIRNHTIEDEDHNDDNKELEVDFGHSTNNQTGQIIQKEEIQKGKMKGAVYLQFFKAIGGVSYPLSFVVLLALVAILQTITPLLLAAWTSENSNNTFSYLTSYSIISGISVAVNASFQVVCLFMAVCASCNIHDSALSALLDAPLSFFDQNPIGRILNRFSSDVEKLDRKIGYQIMYSSLHLVNIICNIIIVSISNYFVLGLLLIILLIIYQWFTLFRPANLDFQRLLSVTNSPVDAHISETLAGIAVVRAYNQQENFIDTQMQLLDKALAISYTKESLHI